MFRKERQELDLNNINGFWVKPDYVYVVYFVRKEILQYKLFISQGQARSYMKRHQGAFVDSYINMRYLS